MRNIKENLAIQSFCFRGFPANVDVVEKLKETGVSAIEICDAHIDFSRDDEFDAVIELYKSAGIRIVSIGVNRLEDDGVANRKLFDFCKKAGTSYMSIDFSPATSPESWRAAELLADEYDVFLGIHNHGGRHWLGSIQMISHVLANTSERIGLCLDTAWACDSGEDPIRMAELFAGRLVGVHFKDFIFDRARSREDIIIGQGNLDLPKLVEIIKQNDKIGYAVIEYQGDVSDPVPALVQCVREISALC